MQRYSQAILIFLMALFVGTKAYADTPDEAYHNPEEIISLLFYWQEEYPDLISVDSIGHSSEYGVPIYMAKLSDNPRENETEPSLLFIGQIHAEEIMGIEVVLELVKLHLENHDSDPYRSRIEGLQLFFIPTMNPEGLDVVYNEDYTYRKNCRDNIGDGVFRYHRGAGWDTSGVDLNRNFGLHWDHGDAFLAEREVQYIYNYYRGHAPFSEPETQAIRDLVLQHRFLYSINYHSSRSGNNSEMVIGPWYWEGRYPPDHYTIEDIGEQLASMIPTADGESSYQFVQATQRNGQSPDWFYQAAGTIQYMVEIGVEIQPDSTEMRAVAEDNLPAAFYLMDLALGVQNLDGYGTLNILANDNQSSTPINAVIEIDERNDPVIVKRETSALNGRFDWLLPVGQYNISVGKFGYRSVTRLNFEVLADESNLFYADLTPLQQAHIVINTVDFESHDGIASSITLTDEYGDDHAYSSEDGSLEFDFPVGHYSYTLLADNHLPIVNHVTINANLERTISMYASEIAFSEDFDNNRGWLRGGTRGDWGVREEEGRTVLTESENGLYSENIDTWLLIDPDVYLDTLYAAVFKIVHRPYFEPGHDFASLQFEHPTTGNWMEFADYSEFPADWKTEYFPLSSLGNGRTRILFNVTTDSRVDEDGWLIDRVEILRSTVETPVDETPQLPVAFSLSAFPNPFNSSSVISLNLPQRTPGSLTLFDLTGRKVEVIHQGVFAFGNGIYYLDGAPLPSGSYLLQFKSRNYSAMTRLVIIR